MRLFIQRKRVAATSLIGELIVDDRVFGATLEPRHDRPTFPAIPAGRYKLTVERYSNTRLWSPNGLLPRLNDVPGRVGVLIHAGNTSRDTEGCIIVGATVIGKPDEEDAVAGSRIALRDLIETLDRNPGDHIIEVWDIPHTAAP